MWYDLGVFHIADGFSHDLSYGISQQDQGQHFIEVDLGFIHHFVDVKQALQIAETDSDLASLIDEAAVYRAKKTNPLIRAYRDAAANTWRLGELFGL